MIDLDKKSLATLKHIFKQHLPTAEVKIFGSRVTNQAKPFSDIDVLVIDEKAIPTEKMNALKFECSNSDLPILVDIVDWHQISNLFREKINQQTHTLITKHHEK